MCLSVPGKVLEVMDPARGTARVEVAGVSREVNLTLLFEADRPGPGDWVLVHAGFALSRVDEAEAIELLGILGDLTRLPDETSPVR